MVRQRKLQRWFDIIPTPKEDEKRVKRANDEEKQA